jgi:hypothetical protein
VKLGVVGGALRCYLPFRTMEFGVSYIRRDVGLVAEDVVEAISFHS